jgi:hypothetical protein
MSDRIEAASKDSHEARMVNVSAPDLDRASRALRRGELNVGETWSDVSSSIITVLTAVEDE